MSQHTSTAIAANDRNLAIRAWVDDSVSEFNYRDLAAATVQQIQVFDLNVQHPAAVAFGLTVDEAANEIALAIERAKDKIATK